ncbi:MAG: Peptide chain release factor [Labilithrix sp.]|nr:Peptide chain release factor [Labilithrix sp.]
MIPAVILVALAQIAPPGDQLPAETVKPKAVTTGKTDLVASTFATGDAVEEAEEQYATEGSLSLGGLFASGNARQIALTTAGKVRVRRYENQITAAAAWNFARAAKKGETLAETTVENYQALGRYDLFLSPRVSLFLQSTIRRDRFQGLDLRLNIDPGVAYHFIQTANQRLVVELGYDLQHDIRRDASRIQVTQPVPPALDPTITIADKTRTLHNSRAYLGYENKLYSEVSFVASLEHIQNFENAHVYRLVFDTGLKSTIRARLAVAMTYTMRFENRPLPGVERADSLASISLVYTLF